jgi:WD40 repeat protein
MQGFSPTSRQRAASSVAEWRGLTRPGRGASSDRRRRSKARNRQRAAAVAFGSDGTELVSGGSDGTVAVWDRLLLDRDFDAWRKRLCRLAGRNLTEADWAQFLPGQRYRTTCPDCPRRCSAATALL